MPDYRTPLSDAGKQVDPELARVLAEGDPQTPITVFLQLRSQASPAAPEEDASPSTVVTFPFARRREAIESVKQAAHAAYGGAFEKVVETGVRMLSAHPAAVIVVEGLPDQLRRALAIDDVIGGVADFDVRVQMGDVCDPIVPASPRELAPSPRYDNALVRHLEWILSNHPRSPIGKLADQIARAVGRANTSVIDILHELRDRIGAVEGLDEVARAVFWEFVQSLRAESTIGRAEGTLRECLIDVGAWSATFFVRDPWMPGEYRLILFPGVKYPEPLVGCNSEGSPHAVLVEGHDDEFFNNADDVNKKRVGFVGPVTPTHLGFREALDQLIQHNALFGTFSQRERIRSSARLLGRRRDGVVFSLWVNFADHVEFERHDWIKERLNTARRELLEIADDVIDELPPPFSVDRFNELVEPARRLTATAQENPDITLNNWLAPILNAALDAFRIRDSGFATILLIRPGTGMLELVAGAGDMGLPSEPWRQSLTKGEGLAAWVALKGHPVLIDDLRQSDFRHIYCGITGLLGHSLRGPMLSELAVPMTEGNRVIGVLNLESARVGAFRKESVPILTHAAHLAAFACQKWDQETTQRERQVLLERLFDLSRRLSVASSNAKRQSLRTEWASIVCDTMEADYCDLWRYEPDVHNATNRWTLLATHAGDAAKRLNVEVRPGPNRERGWSEFVVRHKQLVCITNVRSERDFKALFWKSDSSEWFLRPRKEWEFVPESVNPLVNERSMRCELGIPILAGNHCHGIAWVKYLSEEKLPLYASKLKDWLPGTAATAVFNLQADEVLALSMFNMQQVNNISGMAGLTSSLLLDEQSSPAA